MAEYLLSVWSEGENVELAQEDIERMFAQVDVFNNRMQSEGKWVFAGGLQPASTATVVSPAGELTDGPFSEAKEQLGGFWVLNLADLDEALAVAKDAATACEGRVEVRPFQPVPA